ncbi:hypothetical protein [Archangium sp. Cb G35]|uniref:hypothetical protein n=1 Tax=Archangium sp. Cb G35 TaxID=1920190 RepID=UPI0011614BF0|nr:hypothetical protein [Archangium sp. Cb G35]
MLYHILFFLIGNVLVLLALFAWVYRGRWPPRKDFKLSGDVAAHMPFTTQHPATGNGPEPHLTEAELDRLASALSWTLGPLLRPTLDAMASVKATARRGGFPTIVQRRERRLRKILVLADTGTEVLRERRLEVELASGLERRGLPVELIRWRGSLPGSVLEEASWKEIVLLVVSDARHVTALESELQRLVDFPHKVWIDPRDPAVWGSEASRISQRVPLISADANGWARLQRVLDGAEDGGAEPLPVVSLHARVEARDPGVAGDAFTPAEARRLEAALGPLLPWACALAAQPLAMPGWYAHRLRRELRAWAEGPGGEANPGIRVSLGLLSHLSLDRLRALPGVQSMGERLGFSESLARFLVQEVMAVRWPRLYRRALEFHETMLLGAPQPSMSLAELERQAVLAMIQWQLAVLDYREAGRDDKVRRRQADLRLMDASLTLRSLQRSRLHAWVHSFMQGGRLPRPADKDIPWRMRPWVLSAMAGADPDPWTPVTTVMLKVVYPVMLSFAPIFLLFPPLHQPPSIVLKAIPLISLRDAGWRDGADGRHLFVRTESGVSDLGRMPELRLGQSLYVTLSEAQGKASCVDSKTYRNLGFTVLRCAPPIPGHRQVLLYRQPGEPQPALSVVVATEEQLRTEVGRRVARRLLSSYSVDLVLVHSLTDSSTRDAGIRSILEREFLGTLSPINNEITVERAGLKLSQNLIAFTDRVSGKFHEESEVFQNSRYTSHWDERETLTLQLFDLPPAELTLKELISSRTPRAEGASMTYWPATHPELRQYFIARSQALARVSLTCTLPDGVPTTCKLLGRYSDGGHDGALQYEELIDFKGTTTHYLAKGRWDLLASCVSEGVTNLFTEDIREGSEIRASCRPQSVSVTLSLQKGQSARLNGSPLDAGVFQPVEGRNQLQVMGWCGSSWSFIFQVTPEGRIESNQSEVLRATTLAGGGRGWEIVAPVLAPAPVTVALDIPQAARTTLKRVSVTVGGKRHTVSDLNNPSVSFDGLECGTHPVTVQLTRAGVPSQGEDLTLEWKVMDLIVTPESRQHQIKLPKGFLFLGDLPPWLLNRPDIMRPSLGSIGSTRRGKVWFFPNHGADPLHLNTYSEHSPDTFVVDTRAWPVLTDIQPWAALGSGLFQRDKQIIIRGVASIDDERMTWRFESRARHWVAQALRSMLALRWYRGRTGPDGDVLLKNLLRDSSALGAGALAADAKLVDKSRDGYSQRLYVLVEKNYFGGLEDIPSVRSLPQHVEIPAISENVPQDDSTRPEWVDRAWPEMTMSTESQIEALGIGVDLTHPRLSKAGSLDELTAALIHARVDLLRKSQAVLPKTVDSYCWEKYLFNQFDSSEPLFEYLLWVGDDATFVRHLVSREQLQALAMKECGRAAMEAK